MGQSPVSLESSEAPVDSIVSGKAETRSAIIKIIVAAFCIIAFYPLDFLAEADSDRSENLVRQGNKTQPIN